MIEPRETRAIDAEILARARKMYEDAPIPHYMDFDDLPHFQWSSWIKLAKHEVH